MKKFISIMMSLVLVCTLAPAVAGASALKWDNDIVYVENSGDSVELAKGGTLTVDYSEAAEELGHYWSSGSVEVSGSAATVTKTSTSCQLSATGNSTGTTTVKVTYQDGTSFSFTIDVFDLATSASATACVAQDPSQSCQIYGSYSYDYSSAEVNLPVKGLPASLPEGSELEVESDSNTEGGSWVDGNGAGSITLHVYGSGTHNIVISTPYGVSINAKVELTTLKLKEITTIKRTGSVVTKVKKKTTLTLMEGDKAVNAKWASTKKSIATVSSKGVVTGKKKGNCYVKATYAGQTIQVYVEVTSKKAYAAVQNAWKDYGSKIKYNQNKRNSKGYRDCSSFVSRCFYSNSPKRRVQVFGDKSWPMPAANQAKYLNKKKKCVAKKAVSISKLRPGDTVYYETGYAGKNNGYRNIDHAAIYVGNGWCLNTGRNRHDGKAYSSYAIGYRYYNSGTVKFIGRLCA